MEAYNVEDQSENTFECPANNFCCENVLKSVDDSRWRRNLGISGLCLKDEKLKKKDLRIRGGILNYMDCGVFSKFVSF